MPLTELEYTELAIEADFVCDLSIALDFAELPESATPEQLDKVAVPIVKYLLSSGQNGYKDTIDDITDSEGNPPSSSNGWLYDADLPGFKGLLIDRRSPEEGGDKVIPFQIVKNGEEWESTT